jgi:hypothetical protein
MPVVNCPSSNENDYAEITEYSSHPIIIAIILRMGNKQTGIHPTHTAVLLQMVTVSMQTSVKVIRYCYGVECKIYRFPECGALWFGIYLPMLRKSLLQPSSGCKNILN